MNRILVTGGAGFVGSAVIRYIINNTQDVVINVDKLTYAGNLNSLETASHSDRYFFEQVDICDEVSLKKIFNKYKPNKVMHLAAESHVDRSINTPAIFIKTNIVGTYTLLEVSLDYFRNGNHDFLFHHVSTDEVYGDLFDSRGKKFNEESRYNPSSPYSASKASSDHLVRAWSRTFGLPIVISNSSNNYGPHQSSEKFIPHIILNALKGEMLPIYGSGSQIRDWIYVEDHARVLYLILTKAKVSETYNISGNNEMENLKVAEKICEILDEFMPKKESYRNLIKFVKDRPGHDKRYAIDSSKVERELGWRSKETFDSGMVKTIKWYIEKYR